MKEKHPDNIAVDKFAAAMKRKLARKRREGRGGWSESTECTVDYLASLLMDEVTKMYGGPDPVDIANYAMMIHIRKGRAALARAAHKMNVALDVL